MGVVFLLLLYFFAGFGGKVFSKLCSNIVGGNYLFAILIFAIIVEILLLPFGIKQQKNSIKRVL